MYIAESAITRKAVGDYLKSAFGTVLAGIEVEQLRANIDSKNATVTITWRPPLGRPERLLITGYEIRFKQVKVGMFWVDHPQQTLQVVAGITWIKITRERGLKPLEKYVFDVRAVTSSGAVGKWSSLSCFIGTYGAVYIAYIKTEGWCNKNFGCSLIWTIMAAAIIVITIIGFTAF